MAQAQALEALRMGVPDPPQRTGRWAHVEALGHLDPPDTDFAGPVVIWVIGRLDVAIVLFHISPADGFGDKGQGGGEEGVLVRML